MRRARGLRVSSPRDVCIFCASRQVAIGTTYMSSSSAVQRRQLNSSSRAPQSAEAVLYKDDSPTPQPMTQAQRMRQALAANSTFTPPAQSRAGQMNQAERMRQSLAQQTPRQPPPPRQDTYASRRPLGGLGAGNRYGQSQRSDGFAPSRRQSDRSGINDASSDRAGTQSRYNVNMNSRPQLRTPAFNSAHLRRQNEPQGNAEPRRAKPVRTMLDQDEISKLLGNAASSDRPTKPYQPLARENNAQRKCWHCGSIDHMSNVCPNKPTLRERTTNQGSEQRTMMWKPAASAQSSNEESLADAAQSWISQKAKKFAVEPQAQAWSAENDNRRDFDQERRRNRFEFNSPNNASNKVEGPEKRGRQNRGRRVQRFDEEEDERPTISKAERKRMKAEAKKAAQAAKNEPTPISLPEYISVANLASALKLRVEDFVRKLEELGFEDIQNDHILNAEHANLIAQEYNFEPTFQSEDDDGDLYAAPPVEPEVYAELPTRPPVVTIMGHVDHGKTTILDYMRSTSVAASEFGGITQHIGAFSVPLANGKKITFLDTPGHSAFETMRARGANVTDIVVLVVAADDSVKPQTVEAIKHAQAAKVPIIVAINKIDKAQADPEAVKLDLGGHGIEIEDFGGDVQVVCVSGKTGQGIPDLEEAISTLSEMLDHRADPEAAVEGWVLEGSTKASGRVATVLVRSGTLKAGVNLVAGTTWAKIRSLRNEAGVEIEEVGPGMAVEVAGWRDQPIAGDEVLQAEDDQHASAVAELRTEKVERQQMAVDMEAINEFRRAEAHRRAEEEAAAKGEDTAEVAEKENGPEVISFIIKGDVSGSVEAVIDSVSAIGNAEVSSRILRHGVGSPSEFDVSHAADAGGHIINFNTPIPNHISRMAEEKGVRILDSNIIYRVVENVKELMSEKLKPNVIKKVTGEAEIAAVFEIGLGGKKKLLIAGSKVRNGQVDRGSKCRVLRGENVVHEGSITSLKNVKKDVESMRKDTECGIGFEHWEEFKIGDRVQCYEEIFEKRTL